MVFSQAARASTTTYLLVYGLMGVCVCGGRLYLIYSAACELNESRWIDGGGECGTVLGVFILVIHMRDFSVGILALA